MLRLTLLALIALTVACGPTHSERLEAHGGGRYDEVHTWTTEVPDGAGRQRLDVAIEVDPAQLMGWARSDQQYRMILDVRVAHGDTHRDASLMLPVTEMAKVRDEGDTRIMRLRAAGKITETGFRRGESKTAFTWSPSHGQWTLTVRLRTPSGADRKVLRAVRTLLIDVRSGSPEQALNWTYEGVSGGKGPR